MPVRDVIVNCSILFTDLPLPARAAAAQKAGFDAVEFWWPFVDAVPGDREVDEFVSSIADAGLTLSCLNFAAGDLRRGERGLLSDPAHRTAFRDSVDVAVGIGERLGTVGFNALYGNRSPRLSAAEQDRIADDNLAFAAARTASIGASVLIEPLSGIPTYPITTLADAAAIVDRIGSDSIRILADLYHLTVDGRQIDADLDRYAGSIGHVQIADAPGRGKPGSGSVDLLALLRRLVANGYDGLVAAEYVATDGDSFDWLFGAHSGYAQLMEARDTAETVDCTSDSRYFHSVDVEFHQTENNDSSRKGETVHD